MLPAGWSIVVYELLELLTNYGIRCQWSADDSVILTREKFENILCVIVQTEFGLVKGWCSTIGVNISPSRTTIVPFTKRKSLPGLRILTLGGRELQTINEVKYLGFTLDFALFGESSICIWPWPKLQKHSWSPIFWQVNPIFGSQ